MLEFYLISVAIKSTILLAAGIVCSWFLRAGDAAVRHSICLASLVSAASVLSLAFWPPQWSVLITVPAAAYSASGDHAARGASWNWPTALASIWALGTVLMLLRAAGGWIALLRVRSRTTQFQAAGNPQVRLGDVSTPLTCGVLQPLILLPQIAQEWDEARLRAVLLHESAHVRRRDCLAKYAALGARALLWWNPLAWILAARLNHEQEMACDDAVLSAGVSADAYAMVLLDAARECSSSLLLGCAMSAPSTLHQRFAHLFEWRQRATGSTRRAAIAIPLLLVFMTGVSFAEKIYKVGPGIVPPKVLEKSEPKYTDQARAAKLEGTVGLTIVVGADQHVHDIKVIKSLDPGLDANAIASIKTWRFQPGTKGGKPVLVRARIDVNFRLR